MHIKYGPISIGVIQNSDISLAAECRSNNHQFFFGGDSRHEASMEWIVQHRDNEHDALCAIRHDDTQLFLGTVGYTVHKGWAEVGRLSMFTPSIRQLLAQDVASDELSKSIEGACKALIDYLFVHFELEWIQAEVMPNNQWSIAFCQRLGLSRIDDESDERKLCFRLERQRYLRSKEIRCLFFQHNMIEPTHHAIGDFLEHLQKRGVVYQFAAKRVLRNEVFKAIGTPDVQLLSDLSLYKPDYHDIDLIHVVYDGQLSLALCAVAYIYDIPYILTFHGGDDTNRKIFTSEVREKTVELANHASAITVVCRSDQMALQQLGVTQNIDIMPPAIRVVPSHLCTAGKNRHGIVVIGRMVPKKGIETAIRALELMPAEYSMDIVGDGPLEESLRRLAINLGVGHRITWHGLLPIEEMITVMQRNALIWHPSTTGPDGNADGIPQTLLYAMRERLLVIATHSGHISDLVTDNVNGLLVPPDDPQALARTTLQCSSHDMARLITRGAQTAKTYDIEEQTGRWLSLYQNIRRGAK